MIAAAHWRSVPAMFFDWADRRGDRPFLSIRNKEKRWQTLHWREAAVIVRHLARGLAALGVSRGDRVALIAENRPEWILSDLAIMSLGAITVPAYTTYTSEDYRHVLANSGAKLLIFNAPLVGSRVLPAADQLSYLSRLVTLEPLRAQTAADCHAWDEVLALGAESPDTLDATVAALHPDDTACLIYTSGTGGVPKGVMLSHRNLISDADGARHVVAATWGIGDEVFLNFLPLTHSYEHTAGMILPVMLGAHIYFTQGAESLAGDMADVRPTFMTAVPRLCEMLHRRIEQGAERSTPRKRQLFHLTIRLGRKRYEAPKSLSLRERILDFGCERLVRRQIRARFGGRLKAFVSGGAPLNRDVGLFFVAAGITLLQGYGQTEASPVIAVNVPGRIKVDTVGPPLPGVEVRIAPDGEVLVRGPIVMKGYWNDAESTARAIRDGWLHTGDIGTLDEDGFLTITDRKRDFLKTTGGEMISPARLEGFLTAQEDIGQAMVHGDGRPYIVALIVPEESLIRRTEGSAEEAAKLQRRIAAAVAAANRELSPLERIRRFAVIEEPFSVANGQMTPTLKIKRHIIRRAYASLIDGLYEGKAGGAA